VQRLRRPACLQTTRQQVVVDIIDFPAVNSRNGEKCPTGGIGSVITAIARVACHSHFALSNHNDFTPEQLSAFRGFLTILQQVATDKDTDFTNIKDLLQRTSNFCTTIRGDLQEKFQSGSTDWSLLNRLGDDVNSYTRKLRLYTSALGVGAIGAAP
jgi:hypothetical protein